MSQISRFHVVLKNWASLKRHCGILCEKILAYNAFKIELTQELKPLDHLKRRTIDLLKGEFGERVILRNGPVEQPHRSCDLTPLDFFLWGHIKSLVYANKPATLDDLKDNIQHEIANVPVEMCARVVENWVQRIDRCKRARGGYMTDIEFHS